MRLLNYPEAIILDTETTDLNGYIVELAVISMSPPWPRLGLILAVPDETLLSVGGRMEPAKRGLPLAKAARWGSLCPRGLLRRPQNPQTDDQPLVGL